MKVSTMICRCRVAAENTLENGKKSEKYCQIARKICKIRNNIASRPKH